MHNTFRKFVAILMLLWLPLFSGSALAATVSMQMQSGSCHDEFMHMSDMDMGAQHDEMPATDEHDSSSCSSVCHLACTGYLVVPTMALVAVQTFSSVVTPYLVSFRSITFAPLLPPPLVRV